jgi:hypothetical protein
MLPALATLALVAHVPKYGREPCSHPPHDHTTSQVKYMRGSGGLELDVADVKTGESVDVDAVFKKAYDTTTYSLHVGCGGCADGDALHEPPFRVRYQEAVMEPFTQTAYTSAMPEDERLIRAEQVQNCSSPHLTVRVVDHRNRSGGEELVWGAVVGLGEQFTLEELLSFPIFILRNHGRTWNGMSWTWFVCVGLALVPFAATAAREADQPLRVRSARAVLLASSAVGFLASALEVLLHALYAQSGVALDYGVAVAVAIALLANVAPAAVVAGVLAVDKAGSAVYEWVIGTIEFFVACALLLFFGSGLYVGPLFLGLSGLLRLFASFF